MLITWLGLGVFTAAAPQPVHAHPRPGWLAVTATFRARTDNGHPVEIQTKRGNPMESRTDKGSQLGRKKRDHPVQTGDRITVGGFADSRYFYGQLRVLEKDKVAGFLYPSKKGQIYVFGEITQSGEIRAFDDNGTLYRLLMVEESY